MPADELIYRVTVGFLGALMDSCFSYMSRLRSGTTRVAVAAVHLCDISQIRRMLESKLWRCGHSDSAFFLSE